MADNRLGEFLAARRARRGPSEVGLPSTGVRRVAGLRREEVATLAGVSADYYTRLEQGRERHPSASVLDAIARALGLDAEARAHLFRLADVPAGAAPAPQRPRVDPELHELLDAWPDTPALVLNRRLDLLATNPPADALHRDFAVADNLARMTFLDPAGRTFFADWERAAAGSVANLRLALGHDPHDRAAGALVAELRARSPEFEALWERNDVAGKSHEAKTFRHGTVGELTLSYRTFDVRGVVDQQLVVYRAAPGSADALRSLVRLAGPSDQDRAERWAALPSR